jgi:diguanylate cyclase (GGDEF)-like protein
MMNEDQHIKNLPGRLSLSAASVFQPPPTFHQDTSLHALRADAEAHRYILATDDEGRIVGVVPCGQILRRLEATNSQERARWEGMPLRSLINVVFCPGSTKPGVRLDGNLDCIAITENENLIGISVRDDVFLSWQRLESMLSAAICDPLTGLMNRLAYERRLNEEWARATRTGSSIAVVVVDLDHFKPINDRFGHQAGDEILRTVASVLEGALRSYDIVARYGGDEFVALCLGCHPEEIDIPIQRVLQTLASQPFGVGQVSLPVSASLGAAVRHGGFEECNPSDLFAAADDCLYQAKRSARQACVVEFGAGLDESIRYVEPDGETVLGPDALLSR